MFVYQRQIIYSVYILSKTGCLNKMSLPQLQSIKLTIKYLRDSLELLMEVSITISSR